ncbi:MAG: nitrous oxide-stimulated promoter family protein [Bacteroidaceae bacterium]
MSASRIVEEKRVVESMIRLYCSHHHSGRPLCPDCLILLQYAHRRLDSCRFGQDKGTCRMCTVHCYSPVMAERIRMVMRWSGPRMLFHDPVIAVRHLIREYLALRKSSK